jgi:hypothetical protein
VKAEIEIDYNAMVNDLQQQIQDEKPPEVIADKKEKEHDYTVMGPQKDQGQAEVKSSINDGKLDKLNLENIEL